MQILITHGSLARTRVLHFARWQLALGLLLLAAVLMLLSGTIYHFVFLKAARDGWPVVSQIVRLVVRDEIAQRDRYVRDNLDVIAQRVGEVQAKLVKLEAMGDRVAGLAGVKPEELKPLQRAASGGSGGPFIPANPLTLEALHGMVSGLDQAADQDTDLFTLMESRLLESRLASLMVPSSLPVDGPVGSGFGVRIDPITGRGGLHTGLDFPSEPGTPVHAAAGGIVMTKEWNAGYGNLLEIDHGNALVTRYAHLQGSDVEVGTLVKRGQAIGRVGNTGRSTGPHLHFEVLLSGAPQDPARFLGAAMPPVVRDFAQRPLKPGKP